MCDFMWDMWPNFPSLFCKKCSRFARISSTRANKYRWKCTQRYILLQVFSVFIFSSRFILMQTLRSMHWAHEKLCFWCIFNLHFGQILVEFWFTFPTKLSLKSAFLSLFFHSRRALVALKKIKKTRRCLNPAAGARDRRITALKKSSLQQQKSTKRRMEFPSETAGNAGWISKSDGIITPKVGRPRGKHRVKKIWSKKRIKRRVRNDLIDVCVHV